MCTVNIELYTFITKYKLTIEHNNLLSYGMEFFFNKPHKTKIIKTKKAQVTNMTESYS